MKNASILLVDDNDDDVALTLRAFKKSNIVNPVVVARDGVEALDYLFATGIHQGRDAAQLPAIILLDLKLPRLGGLEVLRRIKVDSKLRMIRTIILTSSNEAPDIHTSYELGACSYIRKPVDFDKFVEAVGTLGVYWLLLNEAPPIQRQAP